MKLSSFLGIIDAIGEYTGKAVSFLMILMTGYVLFGVAGRYVFRSSWSYTTATSNFFLTYFSLGAAYVYNSGDFVKVDIFTRRLPEKTRAILNAITFVLFFFLCIALLVTTGQWAVPALRRFKFSLKLLNPISWPVSLIVPVGIVLLTLQGVARFVRTIILAIARKENT